MAETQTETTNPQAIPRKTGPCECPDDREPRAPRNIPAGGQSGEVCRPTGHDDEEERGRPDRDDQWNLQRAEAVPI